MMQELYEWYLDNMDGVPVQIVLAVVEEYSDAQERYSPPLIERGSSQLDIHSRVMNSTLMGFHPDYTGPRTGRSKWERIGKPFIEDMVAFNAKIHFWNPAGKILGGISRWMQTNEEWDNPSSWDD